MTTSHRSPLSVAAKTAASFLLLTALVPAQAWTLTDLGSVPGVTNLVPVALNVHGTVILNADASTPWTTSYVWTPTTGLQLLPQPPGAAPSDPNTATHLNDAGDIVGHVGTNPMRAWLLRNGQYTMLGTLPGFVHSAATRINNAGEILGTVGSAIATDNFFRTAAGVMSDPTPGYFAVVHDINDAGLACGTDAVLGATIWDLHTGTRTGHGYLPGYPDVSIGKSIDALGRVAGYSWNSFSSGPSLVHSFYLLPGQPLLDISAGIARPHAMSCNTAGRVVGIDVNNQSIMIGGWTWTAATGMVNLIDLVPNPAQWSSFGYAYEADGINEVGQILAIGRKTTGSRHAILMSPPGWTAPLGAGCAGTLGTASIAAVTAPRIGATLHLRVDRVPSPLGVMFAGLSSTAWGAIPLPADLGVLGAPACSLRVSADVLDSLAASDGVGTWNLGFPDDPSQVGLVFHCQALLFDAAANPLGAVLSDAVTITLGS